MKIEERLLRKNQEDIMEIGSALEKFYNSEAGTIVRAMANAITTTQFTDIYDKDTPADRRLGRAEGVTMLITNIELAIEDMQRLTAEIKEDQQVGG